MFLAPMPDRGGAGRVPDGSETAASARARRLLLSHEDGGPPKTPSARSPRRARARPPRRRPGSRRWRSSAPRPAFRLSPRRSPRVPCVMLCLAASCGQQEAGCAPTRWYACSLVLSRALHASNLGRAVFLAGSWQVAKPWQVLGTAWQGHRKAQGLGAVRDGLGKFVLGPAKPVSGERLL